MICTVPSWVIPGTYVENLDFLSRQQTVAGVELLFYLYDAETEALLDTELPKIKEYADRFVFTVHMPDPLKAEHAALIEKLLPIGRHFILHPPAPEYSDAAYRLYERWVQAYDLNAKDNGLFLTENTLPGRQEAFIQAMPDASLCLDTGHCLLEGKDPRKLLYEYRTKTREIHLHSINKVAALKDGRLEDHRPISLQDYWIPDFLIQLGSFDGIVNSELFSWQEAAGNLAILRENKLVS